METATTDDQLERIIHLVRMCLSENAKTDKPLTPEQAIDRVVESLDKGASAFADQAHTQAYANTERAVADVRDNNYRDGIGRVRDYVLAVLVREEAANA